MSEREATRTSKAYFVLVLAGFALLTLVNFFLFQYIGSLGVRPRPSFGAVLCALPLGMMVSFAFLGLTKDQSHVADRRGLPVIVFMALITAVYYWGVLGDSKEQAGINLKVSEICQTGRDADAQTRQLCRQIVSEHGGYLCNLGETPMTRCERQLRKAADRPLQP